MFQLVNVCRFVNNSKLCSLLIELIITEISKLYGGGASKDADLSIGGGPNNFDTLKTLNIAKELILKES